MNSRVCDGQEPSVLIADLRCEILYELLDLFYSFGYQSVPEVHLGRGREVSHHIPVANDLTKLLSK